MIEGNHQPTQELVNTKTENIIVKEVNFTKREKESYSKVN